MSLIGRICLLLSGLSLIAFGITRLILQVWMPILYIPLIGFFALLIVALVVDFKFIKELLTMRTTKHGMNMGVLILLALALIGFVNFIAIRHDKKFDFTEEKVNSLSEQSVKVVKGLKDDMEIKFFVRNGLEGMEQGKAQFKELIRLYQDESPKIKVDYIDTLKRPDLAAEYKVDKGEAVVFVTYQGRKNRLEGLSEEAITQAMIKATREKNKIIYLLKGHGERDLASTEPQGASSFKKALEDSSFEVKEVALFETKGEVPADADVVGIIGPKNAFLAPEIEGLKAYARRGGHLFIAIDPGTSTNLGELTKALGVEFRNNYVLDQMGQLLGASAAMALGMDYSKSSEITKSFSGQMTLFHMASALKKNETAPADFVTEEIVKTGPASYSANQLAADGKMKVDKNQAGPQTIIMTAKGKMPAGGKEKAASDKEFTAVIVGDSDFVTNPMLGQQLNRDLALNAVGYLSQDTDMVSIRPKQPKGTKLTMTDTQAILMVFAFFIPLPVLLFSTGGVFWYRRRSA